MATAVQAVEFMKPAAAPPRLIVPKRTAVFAARAHRFDALAAGHALGDWLRLLGRLTRAQHDALQDFPAVALPRRDGLAPSHDHDMPPLLAQNWPRDSRWQHVLMALLDACADQVPAAGHAALRSLRAAPADQLESLADRVLHTELYGAHAGALPWVAAALQVYWTHLAICLGDEGIRPLEVPGVCPCCGFLPVASVVRSGGAISGLRYLHCALCNTEWNLVRVKCAACDANDAIAYRQLAGKGADGPALVRAETCDSCGSYLKILYQEQDPHADPVADDLATLALDILVDEAGYSRCGPNLLLAPGSA